MTSAPRLILQQLKVFYTFMLSPVVTLYLPSARLANERLGIVQNSLLVFGRHVQPYQTFHNLSKMPHLLSLKDSLYCFTTKKVNTKKSMQLADSWLLRGKRLMGSLNQKRPFSNIANVQPTKQGIYGQQAFQDVQKSKIPHNGGGKS